jgi:hypothetical protein
LSYCRFIEADVYVFTSAYGIECCGCFLQEVDVIEEPGSFFGFILKPKGEIIQTVFNSNEGMIEHLRKHQEAGHYVPDNVFERLADPEDAAENEKIWEEYRNKK